jgi:hypothetical protein
MKAMWCRETLVDFQLTAQFYTIEEGTLLGKSSFPNNVLHKNILLEGTHEIMDWERY